jgi:hypothetical protein
MERDVENGGKRGREEAFFSFPLPPTHPLCPAHTCRSQKADLSLNTHTSLPKAGAHARARPRTKAARLNTPTAPAPPPPRPKPP